MALSQGMEFLTSCSGDDNDSEPTLTASELLQTTWEACIWDYDAEGKAIVNEECLLVQFLTETQGKSINGKASAILRWPMICIIRLMVGFLLLLTAPWWAIGQSWRNPKTKSFFEPIDRKSLWRYWLNSIDMKKSYQVLLIGLMSCSLLVSLAPCGRTSVRHREDGWYLITGGQKDSLASTPIVTVKNFEALEFDSDASGMQVIVGMISKRKQKAWGMPRNVPSGSG